MRRRLALLLACGATLLLVVPLAWMWWASRVPATYDITALGYVDTGGGPGMTHDHAAHGLEVADLTLTDSRAVDIRFDLTVTEEGERILVNGTTPGPDLRVRQGDVVEVELTNDGIDDGTTLHWHGVDVPNAMDGVAGVTQDAVADGDSFTYRFVAERSGTYWYHAHQVSHEQVKRGLLGALVVDPPGGSGTAVEHVALVHRYGSTPTLNGASGTTTVDAAPGEQVRVRVINTDNALMPVWVSGATYRLLAVDGNEVNQPDEIDGRAVRVTAGGRADLGVTVPEGGLRIEFGGTTALVLGEDPTGGEGTRNPGHFVDLLGYGEPTDPGLDTSDPDREFDYEIGRRPGFLDGRPGWWWTINGHLFPDMPMFLVAEGDVAVFRIANDSGRDHPMHLHGHRALVLSRDGTPSTGSPWWTDSLEVGAGEEYEVAFLANNPGIWMDHCHNLPHAAEGLVAHVMYDGVQPSYVIGGEAGNHPE